MNRLFALLAIPVSLAASPAQAASSDPSAHLVPYDNRGLTTEDGLKALLRRISVAADRVCLDPNGPSPAAVVNPVCRAEAIGRAHNQLADAVLRTKR